MEDILYKNSATDIRTREMVTTMGNCNCNLNFSPDNLKKLILFGEGNTLEVTLPVADPLSYELFENLQTIELVFLDFSILMYVVFDYPFVGYPVIIKLEDMYKAYVPSIEEVLSLEAGYRDIVLRLNYSETNNIYTGNSENQTLVFSTKIGKSKIPNIQPNV